MPGIIFRAQTIIRLDDAPVLAFYSGSVTAYPVFQIDLFNYPAGNDSIELTVSTSSTFASGNTTYTVPLTEAILNAGAITSGMWSPSWTPLGAGTNYFRCRHIRGGTPSAWSSPTLSALNLNGWTPATAFTNYAEGSFSGTKGAWYNFLDSTSLRSTYVDANNGSGTVTSNSPVAFATDLSGKGNHLSQSTGSRQPTWTTAGISFDGGDWLTRNAIASTITDTTLWGLASFSYSSWGQADACILSLSKSTDGDDFESLTSVSAIRKVNGASTLKALRNSANLSTTPTVSASVKHLVESKFDGSNHTMTLDGVDASSVASTAAFSIDRIQLGAAYGAEGYTTFGGTLKSIVVMNRVPTANEITYFRAYHA